MRMKRGFLLTFMSLGLLSTTFAQAEAGSLITPKPKMATTPKNGANGPKAPSTDFMMPKVVKVQTKSGAFHVDAWKEMGAKFRNDWDEPMVYTFIINTNSQWSYGDASYCTTVGRKENKHELRYSDYIGAMTAVKGDGKFKTLGENGQLKFVIKPGESIFFLMNDRKGHYSDNSGQAYVRWTCEPVSESDVTTNR